MIMAKLTEKKKEKIIKDLYSQVMKSYKYDSEGREELQSIINDKVKQDEIKYIVQNRDKLTEEEMSIFKRGRNYNYKHSRKNLKLDEYLSSSGFEAVIGYLYLTNKKERLEEMLERSIKIIEEHWENKEDIKC